MFLHEKSHALSDSSTDLFTVPGTKTNQDSSLYVSYQPVNTLTDGSPIEFYINSSGLDYQDLSRSYLYVKLKVTTPAGANLAADASAALVNLPLHSLFSQIDVQLNDVIVSSSHNLYPYKAYFETLLNYNTDAKKSHLTSEGWYFDQPGKFDACNLTAGAVAAAPLEVNSGFINRNTLIKESKEVEFIGRLHLDLACQNRLLLNGIDIKIKLNRSKDDFTLLGTTACKINLNEISLFVRKVKVSDAVLTAHEAILQKERACYITTKTDLKYFVIAGGLTSVNKENIIQGILPKKLIIGFVKTSAFQGSRDRNPFRLEHFNISDLTVFVDGIPNPTKPYNLNFGEGRSLRAYYNLLETLDVLENERSIGISREYYNKDYTLFGVDLSTSQIDDSTFELIRKGSLRIEINFSVALPESIVCICYLQYDNILEVNSEREIFTE